MAKTDRHSKDAWWKIREIWRKNSKEWEVRKDLVVTALGPTRCVRLRVGEWSFNKMRANARDHKPEPKITERNVGTMRELALAIWAACDFVEEVNPEWAKDLGEPLAPENFETSDE